MKIYQFEELTAALSIIICLVAYIFGINWLFYIYLIKSIWGSYCAIKFAIKPIWGSYCAIKFAIKPKTKPSYTIPEIRKSLEPLINKSDLEFYLRNIKNRNHDKKL